MKPLLIKTYVLYGMVSVASALNFSIQSVVEGVEIALQTNSNETYFLEKSYDLENWEFVGTYEVGDGEEHIERIIEGDQTNAFYRYDIQETNPENPHDTDGDGLLNSIELELPGFTPCCDDSDQNGESDLEEFQKLKGLYDASALDDEDIKEVFASLIERYGEDGLPSGAPEEAPVIENKYSDPFYNPYTDPFYDYYADPFNDPNYEPILDPHYNPLNDPTINPTANPIDDPRSWGDDIVGYDPFLDQSLDDTLQDPFSANGNGGSLFDLGGWNGDSWMDGDTSGSSYWQGDDVWQGDLSDTFQNDSWLGDSWMDGF